jgi:hypothetical protein
LAVVAVVGENTFDTTFEAIANGRARLGAVGVGFTSLVFGGGLRRRISSTREREEDQGTGEPKGAPK